MSIKTEELTKRIFDMAVDGIGLYIIKKLTDYGRQYTIKAFKEYNDPAVKIGLSMVDLVIPKIKEIPYFGDWLALYGRDGMRDLLVIVIDKPPICYATDQNTIHCVNFDTTNVTIKIDGTDKTPNTDYTISGTADSFDINLSTALSSGAHDLVVAGNKIAWSGKIYV
jgi:hypothetical protein